MSKLTRLGGPGLGVRDVLIPQSPEAQENGKINMIASGQWKILREGFPTWYIPKLTTCHLKEGGIQNILWKSFSESERQIVEWLPLRCSAWDRGGGRCRTYFSSSFSSCPSFLFGDNILHHFRSSSNLWFVDCREQGPKLKSWGKRRRNWFK